MTQRVGQVLVSLASNIEHVPALVCDLEDVNKDVAINVSASMPLCFLVFP